jgi:hypothetical protein
MFPPDTMVPPGLVILGPVLPKIWDTPKPGTAFRLPIPAEAGRIPGIEPPIPFVLLPYPRFPTTLIPPLFVTPECPWELPCDNCTVQTLKINQESGHKLTTVKKTGYTC